MIIEEYEVEKLRDITMGSPEGATDFITVLSKNTDGSFSVVTSEKVYYIQVSDQGCKMFDKGQWSEFIDNVSDIFLNHNPQNLRMTRNLVSTYDSLQEVKRGASDLFRSLKILVENY